MRSLPQWHVDLHNWRPVVLRETTYLKKYVYVVYHKFHNILPRLTCITPFAYMFCYICRMWKKITGHEYYSLWIHETVYCTNLHKLKGLGCTLECGRWLKIWNCEHTLCERKWWFQCLENRKQKHPHLHNAANRRKTEDKEKLIKNLDLFRCTTCLHCPFIEASTFLPILKCFTWHSLIRPKRLNPEQLWQVWLIQPSLRWKWSLFGPLFLNGSSNPILPKISQPFF